MTLSLQMLATLDAKGVKQGAVEARREIGRLGSAVDQVSAANDRAAASTTNAAKAHQAAAQAARNQANAARSGGQSAAQATQLAAHEVTKPVLPDERHRRGARLRPVAVHGHGAAGDAGQPDHGPARPRPDHTGDRHRASFADQSDDTLPRRHHRGRLWRVGGVFLDARGHQRDRRCDRAPHRSDIAHRGGLRPGAPGAGALWCANRRGAGG